MTDVSFYQVKGITPAEVDGVLPRLVEKILERDLTIQIVCPSQERLERVDDLLWAYEDTAFLPHCRFDDDDADGEPVVLALDGQPVNSADVLIVLTGQLLDADLSACYQRVLDVFDASDNATKSARERWKAWKSAGAPLSYFAHEEGKWVKKA